MRSVSRFLSLGTLAVLFVASLAPSARAQDPCPNCPPPDSIPYLQRVVIGNPDHPGQVCPGDSIPVTLVGAFPDDCVWLAGIQLIQYVTFGIRPAPPELRIYYAENECLARPCTVGPVPWIRELNLPPLPPGPYGLSIVASKVTDFCIQPPDTTFLASANIPFGVTERCSTDVFPCLLGSWVISTDPSFEANTGPLEGRCDAFLENDQASVTFEIGSSVALAGLQGSFRLDPPTLRVLDIEPVGPAANMNLQWAVNETGASWVMFAEEGAPIPGGTLPNSSRVPVLRLTVGVVPDAAATPSLEPPPRTIVTAHDLLGSTIDGDGVPMCPRITVILPDDFAVVCRTAACDFNLDGLTDVRDLVRMVHCVLDTTLRCPPIDCDADSDFDIDDVLCCARAILLGPDHQGEGRPDGSIRLSLGSPLETEAGVDLPLRLDSATPLGGARLAFRFPAERFDVGGLELDTGWNWLDLYEVNGGEIVVGLIALGGDAGSGLPLDMILKLKLKAGQIPGGEIALTEAEFADDAGEGLIATLDVPPVPLGAGAVFDLSPGQPNPFSDALRFSVTLPRSGDLEVGVFDLVGRRVATLHRGTAIAGHHDFAWDGLAVDGKRARSGMYFVRASFGGQALTRKAVLTGGP